MASSKLCPYNRFYQFPLSSVGKEQWEKNNDTELEKSTKIDNIELGKKTMTKWKSNFEINKELECKQLLWEKLEGKKLVYDILNNNDSIIEIIVKMIAMLMNKDNDKKQYF